MDSVIVAIFSFLLLLVGWVAGWVANERQAEIVFEKHRTWFEYAVQQAANSRDIESIPYSGDFFDEKNKAKLGSIDQRIYLDLQAGMKQASVRRIAVVGSDIKVAVDFIMDNGLLPGGIKILAVSPGHSLQEFISHHHKCRPLVDARWHVCKVD